MSLYLSEDPETGETLVRCINLRRLRLAAHLTVEELAARVRILDAGALRTLEEGALYARVSTIRTLARALHVRPHALVDRRRGERIPRAPGGQP